MYLSRPVFINAIIVLALSLLVLPACKQEEKPITAEEVKFFAQKLESTVERRDPVFFNEAVDRHELTRRAGLTGSRKAKEFASGMRQASNMGTKIVNSLSKAATYELVKQYEKDGKHHVIFRLYDDGSINYHDMELIRKKGELKIADIFIYTTGEPMSTTIREIYNQFAGIVEEPGSDKWLSTMPKIREKINEEEYQEAYDLFMEIPEKGRKGKAFRIVYVEICSGLDEEQHQKAIDELLAAYPDEANMQLILIDAYFIRKEYDKVLGAINAVDKMIDKDPFLDYYRYLCHNIMENDAKAKEHLLLVAKNYPKFPDAQLELAATYIEEEKYDSARMIVRDYKLRKSFPQERLNDLLAAYPDFTIE